MDPAARGDARRDARRAGAEDEYFLRYRWDWFPVVDEGGRFLGLVRQDAVARGRRRRAAPSGRSASVVDGDASQWGVAAEEPIEALLGSEQLRDPRRAHGRRPRRHASPAWSRSSRSGAPSQRRSPRAEATPPEARGNV